MMPSGKFIVRLEQTQHASLQRAAKERDCSLNDLCVQRLTLPSGLEFLPPELAVAAQQLEEIGGRSLVGIVLFGSWARREANDLSDVDILVVLDDAKKITRALYRSWEAKENPGTKVEPHFVALPAAEDRVSGLWAEISLDGLLITDRRFAIQRYLQGVRHLIASGRLVAKKVHGQNYWIHTEVA
jgi:predicted nucleotidyltransferase